MRIVLITMRKVIILVEMASRASIEGELHDSVRRHLAEREIRYTAGRRALVTALVDAGGPEAAADLSQRVAVPLSSIYRSLGVLDQADVLVKHHDADGLARFELAEWITGHHHHVVCVQCGALEDIQVPPEEERLIDSLAERLGSAAGYEVTGHNLEIEGWCRSCRT